MVLAMFRRRSSVARVLLLAAALLMAVQPFVLALTLQAAEVPSDWGTVVICTEHGAVTLPDGADRGDPAAPPAQKAPECPYCALGCNWGLAKLVLTASAASPPLPLGFVEVVIDPFFVDAPRKLLRLLTSPPRAPPSPT
jgi:hypothetical protein